MGEVEVSDAEQGGRGGPSYRDTVPRFSLHPFMGEPIRRRELPCRNELVGLLGARANESIGTVRNPLNAAGCRRVVEGVPWYAHPGRLGRGEHSF